MSALHDYRQSGKIGSEHRNFEYVVYEETDQSSPHYIVPNTNDRGRRIALKSQLKVAIAMAKALYRQGRRQPAIYGTTHGGWVGYIQSGTRSQPGPRYRSTGTTWGKVSS